MNFLKNHPQKRVFCNASLSNLENVLKTDRARECIFRVSGGTNFENLSTQCQRWWCLYGFHVCTGLPKKTLHVSLAATNYAILTKHVKVKQEKKLVSNLKSMHIVGFEKTSTKFIKIFVL